MRHCIKLVLGQKTKMNKIYLLLVIFLRKGEQDKGEKR